MTNKEIVAALPEAKNIFNETGITACANLLALTGKITFDDVKTIAGTLATRGTAVYEALVRVIECEFVITLELV